MTARPKVHDLRGPLAFVVHPVRDDLSAARQYGTITYITDGYCYPDQLEGLPEALPKRMRDAMQNATQRFDPDTDFLVICGDHLQLVQFSTMLAAEVGDFNVLRFDRQANGYLPVQIKEWR